jgi:hypothetical protein
MPGPAAPATTPSVTPAPPAPPETATAPATPAVPTTPAAPATPAQPSIADSDAGDNGRFTYYRAGDGYLRLDGRLGQVSRCIRRPAGWACEAVAEERAALEGEIARLQGENAALKRELLARNIALPERVKPEAPPPAAAAKSEKERTVTLLSEEDLQNAVSFVQRMWRGLVDSIADLQRDVLNRT